MIAPRLLCTADLPALVGLLERAGLSGGAANVGRYLQWQPDGAWGIERDGAIVAMVTVLVQGHIGFVGCMAVEPALQGGGLGRALLEYAQDQARAWGLTAFGLEATAAGAVLYRKLGYVTQHESVMLQRADEPVAVATTLPRADELDAMLALDALAVGLPRRAMITSLATAHGGLRVAAGGELAAWGCVVGERLGPIAARDAGAGRAVVEALAPACTHALVPAPATAALAAMADAGFVEARRLERMWLGAPPPSRVEMQWALASPGAG